MASGTLSSEKVKCLHCSTVVKKRNLKEHTKKLHGPDAKVEFQSASSSNIKSLLVPEPPSKIAKVSHEEESQKSSSDDLANSTEILTKLEALHLKVDHLEQQSKQSIIIKQADVSSVFSTERALDLVSNCCSIDIILSLLPFFNVTNDINEEGLRCTICETTLKYDFKLGVDFDASDMLPSQFSHLKTSVKRHIQSSHHINTAVAKEKETAEQARLMKQAKEAAVNCASAAYFTLKSGMPYKSYEQVVTEIHSAGGSVGAKNHSKEFPRLFLPPIYNVLRGSFASYITEHRLPFGILADKMSAKHLKRHIMEIRVPIWDLNNSAINRDVYIRHSAIGYGSGEAVTDHLLENMTAFGFEMRYVRKHLIGMAMDGQYTCLNVENHMESRLSKELSLKDTETIFDLKIIPDTISTIQETMTKFKVGNNFQVLISKKSSATPFTLQKSSRT